MKRFLTSIFALLIGLMNANAQIVEIPDSNFKQRLLNYGVDSNNDGEIQVSEAEAVTILDLDNKSISDLTGIEAFTNVTKIYCIKNNLTILDLSKNTKLEYLYLQSNQLTHIDVTNCPELKSLSVASNQLTHIDVTNCHKLLIFNCMNNNLNTIDLSNNRQITNLSCKNNANLKSICLGKDQSIFDKIDVSEDLFCHSCTKAEATQTVCKSFIAPDGTEYDSSGTYIIHFSSPTSCDSAVTLNLTIDKPTETKFSFNVCDFYTAPDGNDYYESGAYTYTIPSDCGCDDTVRVNVNVNKGAESEISETVCDSYTAPDGNVYTESGIYKSVIKGDQGCDSTITIHLTVDCSKVNAISEEINQKKKLVRTTDILGRETSEDVKGQVIIREYSDGSKEKVFIRE